MEYYEIQQLLQDNPRYRDAYDYIRSDLFDSARIKQAMTFAQDAVNKYKATYGQMLYRLKKQIGIWNATDRAKEAVEMQHKAGLQAHQQVVSMGQYVAPKTRQEYWDERNERVPATSKTGRTFNEIGDPYGNPFAKHFPNHKHKEVRIKLRTVPKFHNEHYHDFRRKEAFNSGPGNKYDYDTLTEMFGGRYRAKVKLLEKGYGKILDRSRSLVGKTIMRNHRLAVVASNKQKALNKLAKRRSDQEVDEFIRNYNEVQGPPIDWRARNEEAVDEFIRNYNEPINFNPRIHPANQAPPPRVPIAPIFRGRYVPPLPPNRNRRPYRRGGR